MIDIFFRILDLVQWFCNPEKLSLGWKILSILGILALAFLIIFIVKVIQNPSKLKQYGKICMYIIALTPLIIALVYFLCPPSPIHPAAAPVSAEFEAASNSATSTEDNYQSPIISFSPNDEDHAEACYSKGMSAYNKRNYGTAFLWIEEAARFGHSKAQYVLGHCYLYGRGVTPDEEIAFYWYQKSAYQNNGFGLLWTGYCYHFGVGVDQDYNNAREYYVAAFAAGNLDAVMRLAELEADMAK